MGAKVSMKQEIDSSKEQKNNSQAQSIKSEEVALVFDIDLDLLPLPVAEHICVFLSSSDVINLSKTCRFWHQIISSNSVWKKMVEHRYGYQAVVRAEKSKMSPPEGAAAATTSGGNCIRYKELYFALGVTQMSVLDLGITWLNDHYLVKEEDDSSPFKNVVHLRDVCWLHIKGKAKNVLPGRYMLSWRLKLVNVRIPGHTEFIATPDTGYGDELRKSISSDDWKSVEKKNGTEQWFMKDMGTFLVTKMCDVTLQVVNIKDSWWKSGLWWDYVELKFLN